MPNRILKESICTSDTIDSKDGRFDLANGLTPCTDCHGAIHGRHLS